ncbi:MAG: nucleotide exchange factor GrpE [Sphingobacteriaceae bacterium]
MLKKKKDGSQSSEMPNEQIEDIQQTDESQTDEVKEGQNAMENEEISAEDKLKEEIAHLNDRFVRLYAEFDNYKRRTSKERIDLFQTAGKDVIVSLLPVMDDFDRAIKSMDTAKDLIAVKEGIALIHSKMDNILTQKGLKDMKTIGTAFNSDLHEAITSIPAPAEDLIGKVVDELEKGYTLNDKVIRFAKVVVGA